jgi:hypothetical protein
MLSLSEGRSNDRMTVISKTLMSAKDASLVQSANTHEDIPVLSVPLDITRKHALGLFDSSPASPSAEVKPPPNAESSHVDV